MAPSSSHSSEQFGVFTGEIPKCLRKPPLEIDFGMANTPEKESTFEMPYSGSTLGWNVMVAPVSKTAYEKFPGD